MSQDRFDVYGDPSSVETTINRNNEEIWIDGPLSSTNPKPEIWIDGPPEFHSSSPKFYRKKLKTKHCSKSHRQHTPDTKASAFSSIAPLPSVVSSSVLPRENDESSSTNFDSESVVSSHCHLPILPVFKDHTLLPFRSTQTSQVTKPLKADSSKLDLRSSANKLNDDMEILQKTLETILIPASDSSIKNDNQSNRTQSLNRIDQLSSVMSDDDKSKRLSRIIAPVRFDQMFK